LRLDKKQGVIFYLRIAMLLKKRKTLRDEFVVTSTDRVIAVRAITQMDLSTLDKRYITITHGNNETDIVEGVQAIEALMLTKPSALEGRRMQWARQAWFIHNTFGHTYLAFISLIALIIKPLHENGAKKNDSARNSYP